MEDRLGAGRGELVRVDEHSAYKSVVLLDALKGMDQIDSMFTSLAVPAAPS